MDSKHFECMKMTHISAEVRGKIYAKAFLLAVSPKSRRANYSLLADCDFSSVVWC